MMFLGLKINHLIFCFLNNRLKPKGFTLVEVLVSLTIIISLSTLVIANFEFGGNNFALQRSLREVSQQIRNTQEMAFSSKEIGGVIPQGGYGIHFSKNYITKYILFTDENGNHSYEIGVDRIIEEYSLEEDVSISGLIFFSSATDSLDVVFVPPDPKVYINGITSGGQYFFGEIHLMALGGATGSISVNGVGLIELN